MTSRRTVVSRPWPTCPLHGTRAVRWLAGWVYCGRGVGWHEDGAW